MNVELLADSRAGGDHCPDPLQNTGLTTCDDNLTGSPTNTNGRKSYENVLSCKCDATESRGYSAPPNTKPSPPQAPCRSDPVPLPAASRKTPSNNRACLPLDSPHRRARTHWAAVLKCTGGKGQCSSFSTSLPPTDSRENSARYVAVSHLQSPEAQGPCPTARQRKCVAMACVNHVSLCFVAVCLDVRGGAWFHPPLQLPVGLQLGQVLLLSKKKIVNSTYKTKCYQVEGPSYTHPSWTVKTLTWYLFTPLCPGG